MSAMTEDEARKLWCPFARVTDHSGQPANRYGDDDKPLYIAGVQCLASKCAAWRWEVDRKVPDPMTSGIFYKSIKTGRCGLAGPVTP